MWENVGLGKYFFSTLYSETRLKTIDLNVLILVFCNPFFSIISIRNGYFLLQMRKKREMSKFYRLDFIYEIRRFKWRFDLFSGQKPWKKRLKKAEIVLRGGIPRISADIRGYPRDIRGYPRISRFFGRRFFVVFFCTYF